MTIVTKIQKQTNKLTLYYKFSMNYYGIKCRKTV